MNITVNPISGYTNITNFTFTPTVSVGLSNFVWNFGDGNYSSSISPQHTYTYPYTGFSVSVSAVSSSGTVFTSNTSVWVENYIVDTLSFSIRPVSIYAGVSSKENLFEITLFSPITSTHEIVLYSQDSKSIPYNVSPTNKWAHLQPRWRFIDTSGNMVSSVFTTDTLLYDSSGIIIGTSGVASFTYIDDIPSIVTIWATLKYGEESTNSNVVLSAGLPVYSINPQTIKLTRNGQTEGILGDIRDLQWVDRNIFYVATIHGNYTDMYGIVSEPIIFEYPYSNIIGLNPVNEIQRCFVGIPLSAQYHYGMDYWANQVPGAPASAIFFQAYTFEEEYPIGGIAKGYGYSTVSATNTQISACINIELVPNGTFDYNLNGWHAVGTYGGQWYQASGMAIGLYRGDASNYLESDGDVFLPGETYDVSMTFRATYHTNCWYLDTANVPTTGGPLDVIYHVPYPPNYFCDYNTHVFNVTYTSPHRGKLRISLGHIYGAPFDLQIDSISVKKRICGTSNLFDIKPFDIYDIRRFNESWDGPTQIRDYALSDHVYNNYNFFENFVGSIVGQPETGTEELGVKVYERTANFTKNHRDIEECGIDQLYSIAQELDVPIDDYRLSFPSEIKRIMDIVAVHHDRLWGANCTCNANYGQGGTCSNCGHIHGINIGSSFDPTSYQVTAGVPFIVRAKYTVDDFQLITPSVSWDDINTQTAFISVYNLMDTTSIAWLTCATYLDYYYYEFDPTICNQQVEGVINWEDSNTTLNRNISGLEDWYGDNGIIETMMNYYLYRGLQLKAGN